MYPIYYTIIIAVSLLALVGTLVIAKGLSKSEKDAHQADEIESYKNGTQSSSIPLLSVIYSVTFVLTIILVWIFIF